MKKSSDLTPILLSPGPVPLSSAVKEQLGLDMTHHRSLEISEDLQQVFIYLKKIFQTKEDVYLLNASGTGAMEAALTNTLSSLDEVLCVNSGKFGERWIKMAQIFQLKVHEVKVPWGHAIQVSQIEEKLKQNPKIKAVFIQACETSTCVLHPIQEIGKLIRKKEETLLIVDGISALIVSPLPMDEWGIDVLIGGSQKSFSLPAGMSFISLSQKAQKFQEHSNLPVFYFDLKKEKKANAQAQTSFSTNVSFIRALRAILESFYQIGIPRIQKKSESLKKATDQFCQLLNLSLFSQFPGVSVTAICIPKGLDGNLVKKRMESRNVIIGGGQEDLKGRIVRFGHLGAIQIKDYVQGLRVFGESLLEQNPKLFSTQELESALKKVQSFLDSQDIDF